MTNGADKQERKAHTFFSFMPMCSLIFHNPNRVILLNICLDLQSSSTIPKSKKKKTRK